MNILQEAQSMKANKRNMKKDELRLTTKHQWWWSTLPKIDCKKNAADIWKLAKNKNIRKSSDSTPSPSAIYEKNILLTYKEDIKEAIKTHYKEVSEGEDKETDEFRKAFPYLNPPTQSLQFPTHNNH